jgi:hypothetical protein
MRRMYTVVVCCTGKMPSRLARLPLDAPLRAIRVAAVVQAALLLSLSFLPAAAQVSSMTHNTVTFSERRVGVLC